MIMSDDIPIEKVDRYKINAETGRLPWAALEKFFASGNLVHVDASLDLVDVAYEFSQDNAAETKRWMEAGLVARVSDDQARAFHTRNDEFWSVVVRPWVLIQVIEQ